jgi:prolyl-tRNA synthetase
MQRLLRLLRSAMPWGLEVVLPPGAEWVQLAQGEVQSFRQLPAALLTLRWESVPGGGNGLARPAWRTVIEWAALVPTTQELEERARAWAEAMRACLESVGLPLKAVDAEGGRIWIAPHPEADDLVLECAACGYAALPEIARRRPEQPDDEAQEEKRLAATPGADTIPALARFLGVPESKTLKAVFLGDEAGDMVFAVVRGDREVSLPKLSAMVGRGQLHPADESTIRAGGAEPGFASPIGLAVRKGRTGEGTLVVIDQSVASAVNMVAGANRPGYHWTGVAFGRDFEASIIADIVRARSEDACGECGAPLHTQRCITLARWAERAGSFGYSDDTGAVRRGSIGIGSLLVEPILAAVLSFHGGEGGVTWPAGLAPYDVHIVDLKSPEEAMRLEAELESAGLEVLLDDRPVSAGVKFADADLIGCPARVTVSPRSLAAGGAEVASRGGGNRKVVPLGLVSALLFSNYVK